MCSPSFSPPLFDVDVGSIDEKVILFLGERKAGDPIPANVITEANPFILEPWDSPRLEGMWYLYNSGNYRPCAEGRNIEGTRIGYWKPMDDITIFRDNGSCGTKTTLEFYIGLEPFGNRTGWMMHEYHRDQKASHGSNSSQDYKSMCRVFLQNGQNSNFYDFMLPDEEQYCPFCSYDYNDDDAEHLESMLMKYLEDEGSSSSTDAPNQSQAFTGNEQVSQAVTGSLQDLSSSSASDPHAYLELNDLYDPDSASSTSDNCSITDNYFNYEELLSYLGSTSSQNLPVPKEHNDYKFYVSTSAKPVALIACHNSHQVGEEHLLESQPKRTLSRSSDGSSSSYESGSKSLHRIVKFGKKYCCPGTL